MRRHFSVAQSVSSSSWVRAVSSSNTASRLQKRKNTFSSNQLEQQQQHDMSSIEAAANQLMILKSRLNRTTDMTAVRIDAERLLKSCSGVTLSAMPMTTTIPDPTTSKRSKDDSENTEKSRWTNFLLHGGKLVFAAAAFDATTTTPRVAEVLMMFLANREAIAHHSTPEALLALTKSTLTLKDGSTAGVHFVAEHFIPVLEVQVRRGKDVFLCRKEPCALEQVTTRALVAPFIILRMLSDFRARSGVDADTPKEDEDSSSNLPKEKQITTDSEDPTTLPRHQSLMCAAFEPSALCHTRNITVDAMAILNHVCSTKSMDAFSWNGVVQFFVRWLWLVEHHREQVKDVFTTEELIRFFDLLSPFISRDVQQSTAALNNSNNNNSSSTTTSEQQAQQSMCFAKTADITHLFMNLTLLSVQNCTSAAVIVPHVLALVTGTVKNATSLRDIRHLLNIVARFRTTASGKRMDAVIFERLLERCRGVMFRHSSYISAQDTVALLVSMGRLKVSLPVDIVELLCQRLIPHLETSLPAASIVQAVCSLHHICKWQIYHSKRDVVTWKAFQESRAAHVMHVALHKLRREPLTLSRSDSLLLLEAYGGMNNSSSLEMFRLLQPQVTELSSNPSTLHDVNDFADVVKTLRRVSTATVEDELLVQRGVDQLKDVFSKAGPLCKEAHSQDLAEFFSVLVEDIAAAHHAKGGMHSHSKQQDDELDVTAADDDVSRTGKGGDEEEKDGIMDKATREVLSSILLEIANRCKEGAKAAHLAMFSRSISRLLGAAPDAAYIPNILMAAQALFTGAVRGCSSPEGFLPVGRIATLHADDVTSGPFGTIASHEFAALCPVMLFVHRENPNFFLNCGRGWYITLRRIAVLADAMTAKDVRLVMHMLAMLEDVWKKSNVTKTDEQALMSRQEERRLHEKLMFDAVCCLMQHLDKLANSLHIAECAALVASMQSMERCIMQLVDREARTPEARQTQVTRLENGDDDLQLQGDNAGDDDAAEGDDDAASGSISPVETSWSRSLVALAKRVQTLIQQHSSEWNTNELRWVIRICRGLTDLDLGRDLPGIASVFYAFLPHLRENGYRLSPMELSLALNCFARAAVWNAMSMQKLLSQASDGLGATSARQAVSLLGTLTRSTFIRKSAVIYTVDSGMTVSKRVAHVAGDAAEAIETLVCKTCCLLQSHIKKQKAQSEESTGGQLRTQDLLNVLQSCCYFDAPPQPLTDDVGQILLEHLVDRFESASSDIGNSKGQLLVIALEFLSRLDKLKSLSLQRDARQTILKELLSSRVSKEIGEIHVKYAANAVQQLNRHSLVTDLQLIEVQRARTLCVELLQRNLARFSPSGLVETLLAVRSSCNIFGAPDDRNGWRDVLTAVTLPTFVIGSSLTMTRGLALLTYEQTMMSNTVQSGASAVFDSAVDAALSSIVTKEASGGKRSTANDVVVITLNLAKVGRNPDAAPGCALWTQQLAMQNLSGVSSDTLLWCMSVLTQNLQRCSQSNDVKPEDSSVAAIKLALSHLERSWLDRCSLEGRNVEWLKDLACVLLSPDGVVILHDTSLIGQRIDHMLHRLDARAERNLGFTFASWVKRNIAELRSTFVE